MPDITSKLIEQLTEAGSEERCGVISREGEVLQLTNMHDTPAEGFRFSAEDALLWLASGEADATWHTHPGEDPNLSEQDYAGFLQWPNMNHWVVGLRDGEPLAVEYTISDGLVVAK